MQVLNERHAVLDDIPEEIEFPTIPNGKGQLLLMYMASESLHSKGLKDHVVKFFLKKEKKSELFDIEAWLNTSLYFKVNTPFYKQDMTNLHLELSAHLAPFEKKHEGKVFWIINYLVTYLPAEEETLHRKAMRGRGNATFYKEFKDKLANMRLAPLE